VWTNPPNAKMAMKRPTFIVHFISYGYSFKRKIPCTRLWTVKFCCSPHTHTDKAEGRRLLLI
jgi:hypothetical protein